MSDRRTGNSTGAKGATRIPGANDRIGVGIIGCGLRGLGLGCHLEGLPGIEVRAVSDVYAPRMHRAVEALGPSVEPIPDFRSMLEDPQVDAVVVATPDHWHATMAGDAVAAGKDVYLEKPVTHTSEESAWLLERLGRSSQVVATGTQQRTWSHFLEARRLVQGGVLGTVTFARCYWHQGHLPRRGRLTCDLDSRALDWERWLGPARSQRFDPLRFVYWRFFWDFGGGSVGDLMTHWIDVVQWFLNSAGPARVHALGTNYSHDWFETPDVVSAVMQFPEGFTATFDGCLNFGLGGCGIVLQGDKAMMVLDRRGFAVYEEGVAPFESRSLPEPIHSLRTPEASSALERMDGSGTVANLRDWLACVRSRREPRANLRAGVRAANTAHWVNQVLRRE